MKLFTETSYWSTWTAWEYSELKDECFRHRTCLKLDNDVTVDGVCIDYEGASSRYEIEMAPYCDEAINIKVQQVKKGTYGHGSI